MASPVGPSESTRKSFMDRFIDTIEWIAAGFVGIVALDIFISVLSAQFFSYAIPDSTISGACCWAS